MQSNGNILRWGIVGLGKIAHKFASDLNKTDNCELYAVASRTLIKAEEFAKEFGAAHAYGNYESLAKDENVDAIYIATPHSRHKEDSMLCLENGKAVLCEKPLALNFEEVEEMIALAKKEKVLLMEALWTRFLPSYLFVKEKIDSGELGKVLSIEADFGFKPEYNPEQRLFNKSLGGGSLLDIGIYPIFMATSILGKPEAIEAKATFFETGADSSVDIKFIYPEGVKANLKSTLLKETPTTATIKCENGNIMLHSRFHEPTSVSIEKNGNTKTHDFPTDTHGYHFEILHFNQLLREGKTESDLMTFKFSKLLTETMDRVKREIGLEY